jgi:hypothetical protein
MSPIDLKNSLTYAGLGGPISVATNNTNFGVVDTSNYLGQLAVRVRIGVKTAGDNDGSVTVLIQSSATNNASNATNLASGTFSVSTTNNTAASGVIVYDTRAEYRYLFARVILAGTNSPAYPISIDTVGQKQNQPAS